MAEEEAPYYYSNLFTTTDAAWECGITSPMLFKRVAELLGEKPVPLWVKSRNRAVFWTLESVDKVKKAKKCKICGEDLKRGFWVICEKPECQSIAKASGVKFIAPKK